MFHRQPIARNIDDVAKSQEIFRSYFNKFAEVSKYSLNWRFASGHQNFVYCEGESHYLPLVGEKWK